MSLFSFLDEKRKEKKKRQLFPRKRFFGFTYMRSGKSKGVRMVKLGVLACCGLTVPEIGLFCKQLFKNVFLTRMRKISVLLEGYRGLRTRYIAFMA